MVTATAVSSTTTEVYCDCTMLRVTVRKSPSTPRCYMTGAFCVIVSTYYDGPVRLTTETAYSDCDELVERFFAIAERSDSSDTAS